MGNYMEIFLLITIFTYVAEASGYTQSKYADSAVHWIQPMLLSTSESRSRPIFSEEMRFRNVESRGKGGKGKGGPKGHQKLPGAGFQPPPGFDGKRVCANAYFTKNMIFSMIQTLEYQKQMAMMMQVMVEGGQLPSGGAGAGTSPASSTTATSTEATTTESTTASTTESTTPSTTESTTTTSTTSTTTTTTTTPAPTSPTTPPPDQPTISPQAVQDLLNLLADILTILPDLLAQFAALEESVNGGQAAAAAAAADEVITPEMQAYEVTDDKQEAIDRLSMLEATLRDTDLSSYTRKLAHSKDLVIRILEQTMQDISVLAPTDLRVQSFVEEFDYLARSHRWK